MMIKAIDDAIFRVERLIVAAMLAVMGIVVFFDVVHLVSTREGALLSSPLFVGGATATVAMLAFMTRGDTNPAARGIGVGIGLAAAQFALVRLFPNGFIWSQPLALAFTLWLGTIGASLAAHDRRHLAMDIGSKLWPESMARKVAALGHVVTALFCLGLVYLAARSVLNHIELGDSLSSSPIPMWFPALSIPYGMAMLTFRFGMEAVRTYTGELSLDEDPLHHLGLKDEEHA